MHDVLQWCAQHLKVERLHSNKLVKRQAAGLVYNSTAAEAGTQLSMLHCCDLHLNPYAAVNSKECCC